MRAGQAGSDPDSDTIADSYADLYGDSVAYEDSDSVSVAISDLYSYTKFDAYTLGYADGVSHPNGYAVGDTHYHSDTAPLSISHLDPRCNPAAHTRISGAFVRGL